VVLESDPGDDRASPGLPIYTGLVLCFLHSTICHATVQVRALKGQPRGVIVNMATQQDFGLSDEKLVVSDVPVGG
jgi:hypothetical protein